MDAGINTARRRRPRPARRPCGPRIRPARRSAWSSSASPRGGRAVDDRPGRHDERPRHRPRRFVFTLADSAFAFACNSYDQRTVAQHCAVTFLRLDAAAIGSRRAVERSRTGRSGIYDVTVTGSAGEVVAEFRGHSRTISGALLEAGSAQS